MAGPIAPDTAPRLARPSGTTVRGTVAVVLLILGAIAAAPAVVVLGLVGLVIMVVHAVWARRGLRHLEYNRNLATRRVLWGDSLPVSIEIWNRKRLPLAWVEADDTLRPGLPIVERPIETGDRADRLLNTWTLGSFERVSRRYHVVAARRGVFEFGPVRLSVSDLFGNEAAHEQREGRDLFLVRPRILPVRERFVRQRWDGDLRARHGLLENPALFAGVREYRAGDSLRRLHWKATARMGQPLSRRFEPARERDVMIALDILEGGARRFSTAGEDEQLESLCVIAGSIARSLERAGTSFGLAAAGFSGSIRPFAYLAPSEAVGQLGRILDLLARLSSVPSAEFEALLVALVRVLRPGTTILVLSGREPTAFLPALRRLNRSGFPILLVAGGRDAVRHAAIARRAGIPARAADLGGSWQTSRELILAG
jgi:uncharacterized protein (DUF58 family)